MEVSTFLCKTTTSNFDDKAEFAKGKSFGLPDYIEE